MRAKQFLLLLPLLAILPGWAAAQGIDLAERHIPLLVTESGILTGSLETRFIPGGSSFFAKPVLTSKTASHIYGLFVPGNSETTVSINGNRLAMIPLERRDGFVYLVDPMHLKEGENTVRFDRKTANTWSGLSMFSLRDTIEEAHFAEAFGDTVNAVESFAARDIQPSPLQTNYDVLWYDCTWVPNTNIARMEPGSEVTMGARALENNLQVIDLDFDRNLSGNGGSPMTITSIDSGPGTPQLSWTYDAANFRLRITLPVPIPSGSEFKIRVAYYGAPNSDAPSELFSTNPMYASTTGNSRPVVYSVSQPYGGRRWWPSKDHPSDKATTTVQRIVVPKPAGYTLTAISNGNLDGIIDQGSTLMYIWRNDYPIATYLMSFAVSEYVYHGGTYTARDGQTTMPVGHWLYPENVGIEGNGHIGTLQVMNFFADKFGEYPFLGQKYQTATWNISYAIEHQTATSMPAGISGGVGNGLTRRNIHELAHQWFGNKVTCENWDHTWLNEGFATYCEALAFEHLNGRQALFDRMNELNPSTQLPVVGPDSQNFRSSTVYHKGATILHMLRYTLGDDAFFKALRDYAASGYTTAVSQPPGQPEDFQSAVEQSAGLAAGSLGSFFTQWLYSPDANYAARPDYTFSAAYDVNSDTVDIKIGQNQGGTAFQMPMDVRLTNADAQTTTVRVSMGSTQVNLPLHGFIPISAEFDPENWIFKRRRASILTASLPASAPGAAVFIPLQGDSGVLGLSWQKLSGSPPWVSVSSSGIITGTPPAAGNYPINVRLTDDVGASAEASFDLVVKSVPPPPSVVINEVLYENYSGPDTAEYVELKNNSGETVDLSGWQITLVNGSTGEATDQSVTLPPGSMVATGDYFVVGNAATITPTYGQVVDYNIGWLDSLQDGAPDAIVLKTPEGVRVDSLNYRSDSPFAAGSQTALAMAEGGTGRGLSRNLGDLGNAVLARIPDGTDTDANLLDFALVPPSPGTPNATGVTLPYIDNFDTGARAEWKPAFDGPVRTASPGQPGKPATAAPSPAGGNVLEVYDNAGGGDVVYLPGDFNRLNVEGYLWIPQSVTTAAWSLGIGIGTRVESAWFSSTTGFGLEHGFYLEYQNGPGIGLKSGRIANSPGTARLIAADSSGTPGIGNSAFSATVLGSGTNPPTFSWQPFRLFLDVPGNRVYANLASTVLYDGPVPGNLIDCAGGVTLGFRENHGGGPSSANREGTWVDNILVDTNTSTESGITDFFLY